MRRNKKVFREKMKKKSEEEINCEMKDFKKEYLKNIERNLLKTTWDEIVKKRHKQMQMQKKLNA